MKRLFVFLSALALLCAVQAQGLNKKWDHHINEVTLGSKAYYSHIMTDYTTRTGSSYGFFQYDSKCRLVASIDSIPFQHYLIDSFFYNNQDQVVRLAGWQRLYGSLRNVYYVEYTYDDRGNIATRTNYNDPDGNGFFIGGIYHYAYNDQNQLTTSTLTDAYGNLWELIEYSYNDQGLLETELWKSIYAGVAETTEKICYYYHDGRLDNITDSVTENNGNSYSYFRRQSFVYDDEGNCLEHHKYDLYGESERNEYVYDYSKPLSSTKLPIHFESERPHTYANQKHACIAEHWWAADVDHVLQYLEDYEFHYKAASAASISNVDNLQMKIYPNPATESFKVEGLQGQAKVSLFDEAGRLSFCQMVGPDESVSTQSLAKGTYVVVIEKESHSLSSKLIIR